jgi:glutathione S-transferase
MKLYHCTGSRSARVLWLLEELGLPYEIEVLPFDPEALRAVDYFAIDPYGKLPMLVDDAVTMFESVAIVQYVLERYGGGRLMPERGSADFGECLQWMQFGETTLMGPVSQVLQHVRLLPEDQRRPEVAEQGRRTFAYYAGRLDRRLSSLTYLIDDEFSAADIVVGYTLYAADRCALLSPRLHNVCAYYQRLRDRPAFAKAIA